MHISTILATLCNDKRICLRVCDLFCVLTTLLRVCIMKAMWHFFTAVEGR